MRAPLSWLREYVTVDATVEEIADRLFTSAVQVDAVLDVGVPDVDGNLGRFLVGRVLGVDAHPNADRLRVCQVDVGEDNARQIVCGAWNFEAGATVAVALPGAYLPIFDQPLDELRGHRLARVERHAVERPLPDLRARDLGRRGVLHEVVDRGCTVAAEPRLEVLDADADVVAQALLGALARGLRHREQVVGGHRHVVAPAADLVGGSAEHPVEDLRAQRHQVGVGHPRPVEARLHLAVLVLAHLGEGALVDLGVAPARDEGRHPADREGAASVAGPHEEVAVGGHHRRRHGHRVAVGEGEAGTGVAENMMSGKVHVKGFASNGAGASAHGGLLVIDGDAGLRCGISLKGGDIVVGGSVGSFSAFMAQAGRMVICGDAGDALGDSLYEAVLYVKGEVKSLGADAQFEPMADADISAVAALLDAAGLDHDPRAFRRIASARTLYHWNADANQEY